MGRKRIAVAGGGVAGLAAALRLAGAGCEVTVLEASERAGGAMRSDALEGAVVDCGVQLLSGTYSSFFRVAGELGIGNRLIRTPGRDALWSEGRAHVLTYGSATSMATTSALPTMLKLKVVSKYLPFLASRCRGLDANDLVGTGGLSLDGALIAGWGEAEMGASFVEVMAYPFLGAYYGATPETTSAALYHALARVGMDVKLYAIAGGMGVFTAAALARLHDRGATVEFGARVEALRQDAHVVAVLAGGEEREYDGAVLALPARACAAMLGDVPALESWLSGVRTTPATALGLVLSEPLRTGCFGIAAPRTEAVGGTVVAACVQSGKLATLAPEGRDVVVAFPAPAIAAEIASASPESVVDRMLPALETMLGPFEASILAAKVYRHESGFTQFYPGYVRHLASWGRGWVPGRVEVVGDWRVAPTVEGAVRSGEAGAARVLDGMDGGRRGVGDEGRAT